MESFKNGRFPEYNTRMMEEMVSKVTSLTRRAGRRGLRIDFEWLADAIGERLARAVLRRAGFSRLPEQWAIAGGARNVDEYVFPDAFAAKLEDIVDYYQGRYPLASA